MDHRLVGMLTFCPGDLALVSYVAIKFILEKLCFRIFIFDNDSAGNIRVLDGDVLFF